MKHPEIKTIGIVGMGMIGDSLSVLTTGHGYKTICVVRRPGMIPAYKEAYAGYFAQMVRQGLVPEGQGAICERYLSFAEGPGALKGCEIIFECVQEDLGLKHEIYAGLEECCPDVLAICSVSSSFTPDMLAEKSGVLKGRIIVTHPYNPVHMVPFVEICGGADTDTGVLLLAKEVLESMGRKPVILKKPAPGFIGNRLQFALWREALSLVESGVCDPRDVDECLRYGWCPRYTSIGIFEHFDNGGLLLNKATCDTVFPTLSNADRAPSSITDRIAAGDTGQRAESGKGFYDWNGVDMEAYRERVDAPYLRFVDWDLPED
ncbi:MAG: 3-hydroxyacyl-CoA dehydrogenase NAD-binding domain-containing protein [Clostridiales bacterium]|nr:3-hydroxyacyl-CoA dehydrogenase NAD-binding domain-containing protein [Clostridiales bacterium]